MPSFYPPTRQGARVSTGPYGRFFSRIPGVPVGQNVWKDSAGAWHTGNMTTDDEADALVVYHGGRTHTITQAEADELIAAGYEVDA